MSCDDCSGIRSRQRLRADELPVLRRARQSQGAAGLLCHRTHLSNLPRCRTGHFRPLRLLAAGRGAPSSRKSLSVNIPAGVDDGTRIRLSDEGEAGFRGGAQRRPLRLPFSIKPHRIFQRDGIGPLHGGADPDDDSGAGRFD